MPEMWVTLEWPDGTSEVCYSPSTIVEKYLASGTRYRTPEFLSRAREAWNMASERVEAKFGMRCSSADDQLRIIERSLARYGDVDSGAEITVTRIARTPP
jgi:uncharacterized repeat protein (TIGR04042 family)